VGLIKAEMGLTLKMSGRYQTKVVVGIRPGESIELL